MPMRVWAEDLTDARQPLQALKALMMGPLLMAGGPLHLFDWLIGWLARCGGPLPMADAAHCCCIVVAL